MKCPVCNVELKIADRQNVEIDYCPQCRGIWLDRGELDKLIEREADSFERERRSWAEERRETPRQRSRYDRDEDRYDDDRRRDDYDRRKRKSFLGEVFDLFD